jgi:hypothetical protein
MTLRTPKSIFLLFLFILGAISINASTAHAKTKLTIQEVREVFIDKIWVGPQGEFTFRSNGNYSYYHCVNSQNRNVGEYGPWKYKMNAKGKIKGETTNYIFYKKKDNYLYYHSKSNNFYRAVPTNKTEFDCADF